MHFDKICISHKELLPQGYLDLNQGDLIVVCGANGVGKSLLFKRIATDPRNADADIAYVDQNNQLTFSNLSVLETISMSTDRDYNEKLRERIQEDGFGYILDSPLDKMSGGEKRIVSLLRGIYSSKQVLLIDEPTNDLDNQVVGRVIELLRNIQRSKTLLVISHDSRIKVIADIIYEISGYDLRRKSQLKTEIKRSFEICDQNKTSDKTLIRKEREDRTKGIIINRLFRANVVSVLLYMVFVLTVGYVMWNYLHYRDPQNKRIREGQMDIYSIASHYGNSQFINVLFPSKILSLLDMDDPLEMIRLVTQDNTPDALVLKGLSYVQEADYSIYPLEYYDVPAKRAYSVINEYLEGEYQVSEEEAILDTAAYFDQPFVYAMEEAAEYYPFDLEKYLSYVAKLEGRIGSSGERLQLSCAVLVFRPEYDRKSFYRTSMFDQLINTGGYITYNELSEAVLKTIRLRRLLKDFSSVLIIGVLILLLDVIYWYLHLKMNKNQIVLLKNYGFKKQLVLTGMIQKMNPRILKLGLVVSFLFFNILMYMKVPFEQMNYYWVLIVSVVMAVIYSVENRIISYAVGMYYRWYV